MAFLRTFMNEIRNRVRLSLWIALLATVLFAIGVIVVATESSPFPLCPEPIGSYSGKCAIDDGEGGYLLFDYENGQQCGSGYVPADGDGYWTGQNCL